MAPTDYKKEDEEDDRYGYISAESSDDDDENFNDSMQECARSVLHGKQNPFFDEDGASKSLRAYASTIDY